MGERRRRREGVKGPEKGRDSYSIRNFNGAWTDRRRIAMSWSDLYSDSLILPIGLNKRCKFSGISIIPELRPLSCHIAPRSSPPPPHQIVIRFGFGTLLFEGRSVPCGISEFRLFHSPDLLSPYNCIFRDFIIHIAVHIFPSQITLAFRIG
jgi:hypothetical protein